MENTRLNMHLFHYSAAARRRAAPTAGEERAGGESEGKYGVQFK